MGISQTSFRKTRCMWWWITRCGVIGAKRFFNASLLVHHTSPRYKQCYQNVRFETKSSHVYLGLELGLSLKHSISIRRGLFGALGSKFPEGRRDHAICSAYGHTKEQTPYARRVYAHSIWTSGMHIILIRRGNYGASSPLEPFDRCKSPRKLLVARKLLKAVLIHHPSLQVASSSSKFVRFQVQPKSWFDRSTRCVAALARYLATTKSVVDGIMKMIESHIHLNSVHFLCQKALHRYLLRVIETGSRCLDIIYSLIVFQPWHTTHDRLLGAFMTLLGNTTLAI